MLSRVLQKSAPTLQRRLGSTAAKAGDNWGKWDEEAQTFHGGQDWNTDNFVEDFSVTTNPLGTPAKALARATASMSHVCHYPPADFEPAKTDLAKWLFPKGNDWEDGHARMTLGNGASELIDLVIRDGKGGHWKPGGDNSMHMGKTQYKEYERSATAAGYTTVPADTPGANLTCLVNPNNPTGDYKSIEDLKTYLENVCDDGSHAIIDESMQLWVGPHWREDSLLTQSDWIAEMEKQRGISIFIMHSWTKIWSCTGLRLGSVIAPSTSSINRIKKKQVPWSVNTMALEFLSEVVKDEEYMQQTWDLTPVWRQHTIDELAKLLPSWQCHGKPYLSWLWVDTGSVEMAERACDLCKAAGLPVRSGKPGYEMPTYIRLAVRTPENLALLMKALEPLAEK